MSLLRIMILGALLVGATPCVHGDSFEEGGEAYKKGDYETAAAKFQEVAEKGDHRAMYALGSMYAAGNGLPLDYARAFEWFSKAAKYGRTDAQYKLGLMYDEGIGVKQNYKRAIRLYDGAAKKAYAHAQFRMGLLYARGNGVKQDKIKACAWFKAAEINYAAERERQERNTAAMDAMEQARPGDIFSEIHAGMIQTEMQEITSGMTPEELQEAQQLAQQYLQYR